MKKKFTMLLALLLCCVGVIAQVQVTEVNLEKWYQFKCTANDGAHGNGTNVWLADDGTSFVGKSATPTFFKFIAANEGKYYIYSPVSGKYVNVDGTSLVQGASAETEWTVGTIDQNGYVYISNSEKNYLNNAGGTNSVQIKNHPNGVSSGNPCSLWYLSEYSTTCEDLGEVENNGSVSTAWTPSTWLVTSEIPEEVANVEKGEYPQRESGVKSVSKTFAASAGYMKTVLKYQDGANRLEILGVELLNEGGDVVDSDYHFGYSGTAKVGNIYSLTIPEDGTYTIRYWVTFCAENNTSKGNIELHHFTVLPIYAADELSNDKVYTVTPSNTASTGAWDIDADATMLSLSIYTNGVDATNKNQQFAFLTVNGETYLYSYGVQKFVADNGQGQSLTDELSSECLIKFVSSTIDNLLRYPVVVEVGDDYLCATNQDGYKGNGGMVTNWNWTNDAGNAVAIVPVDGTVDLSDAIATIEAYQTIRVKAELTALITEATTLAGQDYINSDALDQTIIDAQDIANNNSATYTQLNEQIEALSAAITAAGYVTTIDGFTNNAVYTFVTKRGWVGAAESSDALIGTIKPKVDPAPTPAVDNPYFQWAVYKSNRGKYYFYNIGKQQFMGLPAGESILFAETPQSMDMAFKISGDIEYPIMLSPNNQGAVSQNANAGLFYWSGGWNVLNDDGSNHKVSIVGALEEATLTTIAEAVELYETHGIATQELGAYLDEFYANYYDAWGSGWRNQPGVNNYSQPAEDQPINEAYDEARAFYNAITNETTVDAIKAMKTYLEGLEANLTINQPEAGKFYRLRCVSNKSYLSASTSAVSDTDSDIRFEMVGQDAINPQLMFMYDGTALLSYSEGLYVDTHMFNNVGVKSTVAFQEAANNAIGQYNIKVSNRYIYGQGNTKNNHVDSGQGEPTSTNTNGYNWWLEEVTTLPVAVSAAGYATLYAPVALEVPAEGVTAHTVTVNGKYAVLSEPLEVIPAETGVILVGTEDTHNFTVATTDETATSALTGTFAKTYVADDAYVLANKDGIGLYKATMNQLGNTAFLNNVFKAYLPASAVTSGAQALRFTRGGDDETTSIDQLIDANGELVIYDLAGRRVEKMEKGIYIVNGKKVIR